MTADIMKATINTERLLAMDLVAKGLLDDPSNMRTERKALAMLIVHHCILMLIVHHNLSAKVEVKSVIGLCMCLTQCINKSSHAVEFQSK